MCHALPNAKLAQIRQHANLALKIHICLDAIIALTNVLMDTIQIQTELAKTVLYSIALIATTIINHVSLAMHPLICMMVTVSHHVLIVHSLKLILKI